MTTATACHTCDGTREVERPATPAEVDAGYELGIAYDPCPACTAKRCPRCELAQPLANFALDATAKDGRNGWCRACRNEWARANRATTRPVEYAAKLRRRYGITIDQYEAMLARQVGRCAICRTDKPGGNGGRTFHVDHDHATGRVRGLLCSPCNSGLGHLGDSPGRLREALAYLGEPCKRTT